MSTDTYHICSVDIFMVPFVRICSKFLKTFFEKIFKYGDPDEN